MDDKVVYHIPVMLQECIEGLNIDPDGIYVDLTFGGGGHSKAILSKLSSKGQLYAFDKDDDALKNTIDDNRFTLINDDYCCVTKNLRLFRVFKVNGIFADLGLSSHQIDSQERGFSFNKDSMLDLRMNQNLPITATDVINSYSKDELKRIFKDYADLSNSGLLADKIFINTKKKPIYTTTEFISIISCLAPKGKENKFFAQVFQALRIEVNDEYNSLKKMLSQCSDLLVDGGRLVVLSYHSLEDRVVKNVLKTGNVEGKVEKDFYGNISTPFKIITKKPLTPSYDELERNSRARSAKLRIGEKI
ncbi:MAG: 16S rRNA (cytosine(1402)-N(4))-methyltransferase RsmH [Bacteroidales bacterium]|jgi:16S rRNA (cytosine1402-N4)-methyltransferase|nr:16S rRNA (cytosine(1402)-N(4))-methyltransferase RsmH [Bacteroidales bacterium]